MPLARYFFFVGAALLALLILSNQVLPQVPVADRSEASADRYSIKIRSEQKLPERVVFDTSIQPPAPALARTVKTEVNRPAPPAIAEFSAKARVRETFAQFRPTEPDQLQPSDLEQLQASDPRQPEAKLPPKRKIARKHAAPPMMQLAQQPQFGLLGRNTW